MTPGARRLLLLRAAFAALAGGVYVLSRGRVPLEDADVAVAGVLAFEILANVPYALVPLRRRSQIWLSMQFVVDALAVAALLYLTGGLLSVFVPLCFATVVAAALTLSRAMALTLASLLVIAQAGITFTYYRRHVGTLAPPLVERDYFKGRGERFHMAYLVLQSVASYATALAASRLAGGLRRARGLTEAVLESLDEGVLALDRDGRVAFANPKAREILGLPRMTLAPMPVSEALAGLRTDGEPPPPAWDRPWHAEGTLRSGTLERPVEIAGVPLTAATGGPGAVVVVRDLTLRRHAEEAMLRADRLSSLGELAAGIAHEVRNPLASIRGCAQELLTGAGTDPSRRMLELVLRECDRLNRIVSGVLDYARHRTPRLGWHRPIEIVEEIRAQVARRPEGASARIRAQGDPSLAVRCDADQVRQILWNLVLNALQAYDAPPQAVDLDVIVSSPPPGHPEGAGWVRLDVSDGGRGIPPAVRPNLFRPFFTTRPDGNGLGLATVQRLVATHGGDLSIESRPGRTCVSVWLPIAGPDGPTDGKPAGGSS